ncbi:MAG: hypothetical protein IPO09_05380 [Anaeromyxobacter sp.]|nr:hypothetical protein [Anaeromyxobacter sp.]MBL0277420.1 hypothetical protein [Anaeromyxobacter sp.]
MTPAVLETTLVGPLAAGLGGWVRAIRFYAATPQACPRPGRLDRALWAAGLTFHAARLVATDRGLRRAALLPTGLTFLGCLALAAIATAGGDDGALSAAAAGEEVGAAAAAAVGEGARRSASTLHLFMVSFVALSSMPPTVLQRMWLRVAAQARRALGLPPGEDPFPGVSWARLTWRESWKALRQALVVSAGLAPLLGVARLLPFGRYDAAALAGAWAFYWVVVDAFELPTEVVPGPRGASVAPWYARGLVRLGEVKWFLRPLGWFGRLLSRLTAPWSDEVRFTERHPFEAAGFGLVAGALLATPVLGLFFRAVAITAATGLVGRLGLIEPGDAVAAEAPALDLAPPQAAAGGAPAVTSSPAPASALASSAPPSAPAAPAP